MKILAIDPGSNFLGIAVIKTNDYCKLDLDHIASYKIKAKGFDNSIKEVTDLLYYLFVEYSPTEVVIEDCYLDKNIQTTIKLAKLIGVALAIASLKKITTYQYFYSEIRSAFGVGKRVKREKGKDCVRMIINNLFDIFITKKQEDISDAIALGYYHCSKIKAEKLGQPTYIFKKKRKKRGFKKRVRRNTV